LRYRGAAMAEFWRALRTLKALQAEQAKPVEHAAGAARVLAAPPKRPPVSPAPVVTCPAPNEPESR
jgi:hypothetical protein